MMRKRLSSKELLYKQLIKAMKRSAKGRISSDRVEELVERAIERLDFDNHYQMHKSIQGYADMLIEKELQG